MKIYLEKVDTRSPLKVDTSTPLKVILHPPFQGRLP
jgi:hypothetical protein